jgi:hypothetical protein
LGLIQQQPGARGAQDSRISSLPASRTGKELLGRPLDLKRLHWVHAPPGTQLNLDGRVTLVRWFTNRCPYCARSIPAIMRLQEEFGESGFQTVAVYHPKPPAKVRDRDALSAAADLGYRGPLAVDPDWSVLENIYLSKHPEGATSVSFLLDRFGNVRHVHPGPEYGPTSDPHLKVVNQDYEDIRAAIQILLAERGDR